MSLSVCVLCNKKKTALRCDSCGDVSCKSCVQFIDEDFLQYHHFLPESLQNKTFCMNCYNQGIDQQISEFMDRVEKSKDVDVFSKKQSKETSRIRRTEKPIKVTDCDDKEEALLLLAFKTVEKGFSTIVDVEVSSKKVGEGKSYKKLLWNGTGIPVDPNLRK